MGKIFDKTIEINDVKFCYSKKKDVDEREIHSYHELLYYLGGKATFCTENFQQKLDDKTLIFIPKGKYHSFLLSDPENFKRLKISFPDKVLSEFKSADVSTIKLLLINNKLSNKLLNKILDVIENNSSDGPIFAYGAFLSILWEIFNDVDFYATELETNHIVKECASYIENNLGEDLSIDRLGKVLGYSPSAISHTFKERLGISLHAYIVQKRLIFAKTLLDEGFSPTEIYHSVGYKNYSSFYKAYLKFFKKNPKQS